MPGFKKGGSSDNPDRIKSKNDTFKRDKTTIERLRMYRYAPRRISWQPVLMLLHGGMWCSLRSGPSPLAPLLSRHVASGHAIVIHGLVTSAPRRGCRSGKAKRNKDGKIIGGTFMSKGQAGGVAITGATGRVAPDRRWFGNTRVVGQEELDKFREAMTVKAADPYSVVLHSKQLPMGLLVDPKSSGRAHLLSAESFADTFGPKATRKKPKLAATDLAALAASAASAGERFDTAVEAEGGAAAEAAAGGVRDEARHAIFDKGQSKRIWSELYKVLDCSDVVVQVLDARDPLGTRSPPVEKHLKENARHKHLIFVLNKCDLVPTWVTRRWVAVLSQEYPTLAFHASLTKPFGKGSLIALLRQFSRLHTDKKQISVGFIGYPNVGKSSVINALKMKKVCKVAPIPGETKVWQYVTLMKRVFLIDCPGVVYPSSDTETDIVLKGIVRAERLEAPEEFVPAILERIKKEHIIKTYGVTQWADSTDFLSQLAVKSGRLLKVRSHGRVLHRGHRWC